MSEYTARIDLQLPSEGVGPTLYKLDSAGKLRTWAMELDEPGGMYRTLSGLADGKQAVSGWTAVVAKSCPTDAEQARFEVLAQYEHQLNREYHLTADTVGTPKMIEPMLAKTYSSWPGPGFAQPKLDGIRCIMTVAGMFTRQGQPITAVPHLHAACAPLFEADPGLILDGELYNHDLREDFGAISSIVRKKNPTAEQLAKAEAVMEYHVYDIVDPDEAFGMRCARLHRILAGLDCSWVAPVATVYLTNMASADTFYGKVIADGYEGGIYRLDKPYEIGKRSKHLLKRKEFETAEFEVDRILPGVGNWAGAAKTFVLKNDPEYAEVANSYGKGLFGAGVRGSYASLAEVLQDYKRSDGPAGTVTLRFFGRSPDGVPRFPVVVDYQPEGRKD